MHTTDPNSFSLYIHIPWCVRKCPYCDFNSHLAPPHIPFEAYINCLLEDFELHAPNRTLKSIFIGGGTPSLTPPQHLGRLLEALDQRYPIDGIEVTLEANPGAIDTQHIPLYRSLGINRLSLGVQSFNNEALTRIGRIHNTEHIRNSLETALKHFERINIDLMFGLPGQSVEAGLQDLEEACAYPIEHLSWYQLTLEPGTAFERTPPKLPPAESIELLHDTGTELLSSHGFRWYEISAFTRHQPAQHNLHYWEGGDYIGIGAGAHSKWTEGSEVHRWSLRRYPNTYLNQSPKERREWEHAVPAAERLFEYFLNRARIKDGSVSWERIAQHNALSPREVQDWITQRSKALDGYIRIDAEGIFFEEAAFRFYRSLMEGLL